MNNETIQFLGHDPDTDEVVILSHDFEITPKDENIEFFSPTDPEKVSISLKDVKEFVLERTKPMQAMSFEEFRDNLVQYIVDKALWKLSNEGLIEMMWDEESGQVVFKTAEQ